MFLAANFQYFAIKTCVLPSKIAKSPLKIFRKLNKVTENQKNIYTFGLAIPIY